MTARRVRCPYCRAGVDQKCVTPSGRIVPNHHSLRWDHYKSRMRSDTMVNEIIEDDERFGLKAGDLVYCVNYPYDAKRTIISRISDGYEPCCNQYNSNLKFICFSDEFDLQTLQPLC